LKPSLLSRSGFVTPTVTFGAFADAPNVSNGVTNPVALRKSEAKGALGWGKLKAWRPASMSATHLFYLAPTLTLPRGGREFWLVPKLRLGRSSGSWSFNNPIPKQELHCH